MKQLAHFSNVTWSLLILAFKDAGGETQTEIRRAHSSRRKYCTLSTHTNTGPLTVELWLSVID